MKKIAYIAVSLFWMTFPSRTFAAEIDNDKLNAPLSPWDGELLRKAFDVDFDRLSGGDLLHFRALIVEFSTSNPEKFLKISKDILIDDPVAKGHPENHGIFSMSYEFNRSLMFAILAHSNKLALAETDVVDLKAQAASVSSRLKSKEDVSFLASLVSNVLSGLVDGHEGSSLEVSPSRQVKTQSKFDTLMQDGDYARKCLGSLARVNLKYPMLDDPETRFCQEFTKQRDALKNSGESALLNPFWPMVLADRIAGQLSAESIPVIVRDDTQIESYLKSNQSGIPVEQIRTDASQQGGRPRQAISSSVPNQNVSKNTTPEPTEKIEVKKRSELTYSPVPEIDAYIKAAQRGQAGANPRDVTAARSGDLQAAARVRLRLAQNEMNRRLAAREISASEASAGLNRANSAYEHEIDQIQRDQELRELQRQTDELRRLRMLQESKSRSR